MDPGAQRRNTVLERLDRDTFVGVTVLAEELGCSEMTIRRDLARLEREGKLKRRHGGAVPTKMVRLEFAMNARAKVHGAAKRAIARRALQLVESGQRIILDTGTTTLALAHAIAGEHTLEGLTVVTTSLANASALMSASGVECILLGGTVREASPDLYGPLVEDNLSRMRVDLAFVGCDALTSDGQLMTTDHRIARATQLMVRNSARTVLVTDSAKIGLSSFITYARLAELDCIVTDNGKPEETQQLIRNAGVELLLAGPEDITAEKEAAIGR